jgi:hypothetical protein
VRILTFDQFEFDRFESEEFLRIVVAKKQGRSGIHFATALEFMIAAWDSGEGEHPQSLPPQQQMRDLSYGAHVKYLKKYAEISIDGSETCWLIQDDWNDQIFVFQTINDYILYQWSTSA